MCSGKICFEIICSKSNLNLKNILKNDNFDNETFNLMQLLNDNNFENIILNE